MSLRETFHASVRKNGFTIVELLLVVSLMLIMSVFVFPLGYSFYQGQVLEETHSVLGSELRRTQMAALTGKNNSSFGVYIDDASYTVFQGETYESRVTDQDEIHVISSIIEVAGLQEIVFAPLTGLPTVEGSITLSIGSSERVIEIEQSGIVEK